MSNWITVDDLENEYGIDDFPLNQENEPNILKVENAIADAQFFIEGYLRKAGVTIPANESVINQIKKCAFVVTRYYYSFNTHLMTEELIREYETMKGFLNDIGSGKTVIDDGNGGTANKKGGLTNIEIWLC